MAEIFCPNCGSNDIELAAPPSRSDTDTLDLIECLNCGYGAREFYQPLWSASLPQSSAWWRAIGQAQRERLLKGIELDPETYKKLSLEERRAVVDKLHAQAAS
jgi:predicted nucleic-acid-binding Zn-ribbon protein